MEFVEGLHYIVRPKETWSKSNVQFNNNKPIRTKEKITSRERGLKKQGDDVERG